VQGGGADFRALFEQAPGLYLVLAPDLTIVAVSEAYLRATMTARDAILGRGIFDVFPDNPDDPAATGVANLRASLERVKATRRPDTMAVQKYDIRRPDAEGGGFEVRHWSPRNSPIFGDDGELRYIVHQVEDVTALVRLEEEGREQVRVTEELRSRAGSLEIEMFRRAQDVERANDALRDLQTGLEARVRMRTAELSEKNERLAAEIAERRKAEEALRKSEAQLRQSQKLEAIGRLAGGIAHDFNNLLSVILSYGEFALERIPEGDATRADLAEIRKAGERAAALTQQLLAFSRQQILEPQILDLNDVLRGVERMLARVLGEDVELRLSLDDRLGLVDADRGQIEQVVMNLVVNARDAMPDGGRLTLETSNADLSDAYAAEHLGVAPGRYVMFAVSDTGVGMDKETQSRIFDPFFTTKARGKGTGLGLATVFGIVQQSRGSIWVYSEPGAGATFKVYLPRAERASRFPPAPATRAPRGGTETILLVEDEEPVRLVAREILRRAGYRVLEARSAGEALEISRSHATAIDVLLTDVIMPAMNGRELAARIAAERPLIRALFMSGYTDDLIAHHGVLDPGVSFLQKPLRPDTLLQKVRDVLERK
jgi:signal transduction histidine kinase